MTERWRVAECRSCKEPMIWARTGRGKKIPLDAEPSSAGNFVLEGDAQDPMTHMADPTYTGDKYTSHFATCPNASNFRGKRE